MEPSGFLLVCARVSFPEVGFEALFSVAEQKLLPLSVERLAELHGHDRDEDEDKA